MSSTKAGVRFPVELSSEAGLVNKGSTGYDWYVILLLTAVNACNLMDRTALSVLAPLIKEDLTFTDTQLGLLTGFAFSVCYAATGIPIARWADIGIRKRIISMSLLAWSFATALSGAAQNLMQLCLARMGTGIGEAGCTPTAQSIICDYVPFTRRSGAFAAYQFGATAGTVLGFMCAGLLGAAIGWRWTFVVLGVPGVLLALIVMVTLREPLRGSQDRRQTSAVRIPLRAAAAILWQCNAYRRLVSIYVAYGFVQYGLINWWPTFYRRIHEIDVSTIGVYLGPAIGVGTMVGTILGGVLANKLAKRDVRLPLYIGAVSTLLSLPCALGSLFAPSVAVSVALVALTTVLWSVPYGPIIANIISVVPANVRATSASVTLFLVAVLGSGPGPFCVGLLSDRLTPSFGEEAIRYALLLPVSLIAAITMATYAATKGLSGALQTAGATHER